MSTYFYFECLDHEPPLVSENEITQHDDEHLERAIKLAQGGHLKPLGDRYGIDEYFTGNALGFLEGHPKCALGIVSEYGDHRPIPGREKRA